MVWFGVVGIAAGKRVAAEAAAAAVACPCNWGSSMESSDSGYCV